MTSAGWQRVWAPNEGGLVNLVLVGVLIGTAATLVRPVGDRGLPLLVLVLLVVNCAVSAVRLIPDTVLGERAVAGALGLGAVAAAALLAVDLTGFAFAFGGMASGHAGFRLRTRWALALGAVTSVVFVLALLVAPRVVGDSWPWYFGLLAGVPVLVGLYNRSRAQHLRSARMAAEQALRAAESEARESALAERARIARDMHDVLAHSLSGVTLQLELADALLEAGATEKAHEAVRRAGSMSRDGLIEARRAVQALREDALPLTATLTALAADEAAFTVTGDPRPVPADVSQMLLRAAQESLTNARKYAPGGRISMSLTFTPTRVDLEVVNAAPTAPVPAGERGSGLGLAGMRERAALCGGTVSAGPVTGDQTAGDEWTGGWRVRVGVVA